MTTPTQLDWREEFRKLNVELWQKAEGVSDLDYWKPELYKKIEDFVQSVADTSYEAGLSDGDHKGFIDGVTKVIDIEERRPSTQKKIQEAVDTFRKRVMEELEGIRKKYEEVGLDYGKWNGATAIEEAQEKIKNL